MQKFVFGLLFCLSSATIAAGAEPPAFFLDGERLRPAVISLNGSSDQLQPGDIVVVNGIMLTIGEGSEFRFRTDKKKRGLLFQENAKGELAPVALAVEFTNEDTLETIARHPAMTMAASDFRRLRGLRMDSWWPRASEIFQKIDPIICCVTIGEGAAADPDHMPRLPLALRYLNIDRGDKRTFRRFDELRKLRELRYLAVGSGFGQAFDLEIIASAKEMRYLDLRGEKLANLPALGKLMELRVLRLADGEGLTDLSFAASLAKLTVLDIRRTAVADLTPVAKLPALAAIDASCAAIKKLPTQGLGALRMLRLISTPLASEGAADFAATHPDCRVAWRWRDALAQAVAQADRLVVRSGGLRANPAVTKSHFETKGDDAIAAILRNIDIAEDESRNQAAQDGDPTLEFYRGERLLAAVEMHNGERLRWVGWPYDARLTAASADALTTWLAENGVRSPAEALAQARRKAAATARRWASYFALLPEELKDRLARSEDRHEIRAACERVVPSAVKRAFLYLQLYGIDWAGWNLRAALDQILEETLLPSVRGEPLAKALPDALKDPKALNGASRWFLGRQMWGAVSEEALAEALPTLAKHGLTHPRAICRHQTIMALANFLNHPEGKPLLMGVLDKKWEIRPLPPQEAEEPEGEMISFLEEEGKTALRDCSDQAMAAYILAATGETAILNRIREMAAKAEGPDKEVLSKAVTFLELQED